MKKSKFIIIFVSVLIISSILFCAPSAYASYENEIYEGTTACESAVRGGTNTLIESQKVVFEYNELLNKADKDNAALYKGKVTTNYELFNPSSSDDELKFYLRCQEAPDYFYSEDIPFSEEVSVDGKTTEGIERTSVEYWNSDEKEGIVDALNGDFDAKAYIAEDTPVYINSFTIAKDRDVELTDCKAVMTNYDGRVPVIAEDISTDEKNDRIFVYVPAKEDEIFTVVSVGKSLADIVWGVAQGVSAVSGEKYETYVNVQSVATEQTTYREYLQQKLGAEVSGDRFEDMYSTVTGLIHCKETKAFPEYRLFEENYRIEWKEYTISVPAGERISLCVTESLFPYINENTVPSSYRVLYYIADFGRADGFAVDVEIKTPYYVVKSDADVHKEDYGYSATIGSNRYGIFEFTLSSSANPEYKTTYDLTPLIAILAGLGLAGGYFLISSILFLVMLTVPVVLLILLILLIRFIARRRREKKDKDRYVD